MSIFRLPDIGEGLTEAEIVMWHVGVGDHVVADQPLVSIETDKAVVEIPAPESGHVAQVFGAQGDIVAVGAPLLEYADSPTADTGSVVGQIPDSAVSTGASATTLTPATASTPATATATATSTHHGRATPPVRKLASDLGVDLSNLVGTGPDGSITRDDIHRTASEHVGAHAAASIEPLRGVRRSMAANMARAHAVVVPATVTEMADLCDWANLRDITVRLLRAVAVACRAEPALNVTFLGPDQGRQFNEVAHVGLAVDTADGLFVAVFRDVIARDLSDLRAGVARLQADVVARSIPPEELHGATITLSNFGSMGGLHAALVVVPPQVAIVGAGRVRRSPVAVGDQVVIHPLLPLSLTFDHRAVTGGEATRFLMALMHDLQSAT